MMDILVVENPKKKYIKNMYVNDFNFFHKNSIKMRQSRLKMFGDNTNRREKEKIEKPMPKMIYSSHNFWSTKRDKIREKELDIQVKKQEVEQQVSKAKPILNDIRNMVENFSANFDELYKEDFFITKPEDKDDVSKDKEFKQVNAVVSYPVFDPNDIEAIKSNDKNFKDNLQFSNYEKFKFSKSGIIYPKKYNMNDIPKYEGKDKMEKDYFNYRRKLKYPKHIYNSIGKFNEKLNSDLGRYSSSYGKDYSKGRFTSNPLMKNYYNIIPIYDIYKDIKSIENRYVDSRFKFKMLPLLNARLRKLDKLSEVIYKNDHKKNFDNILTINNGSKSQERNNY